MIKHAEALGEEYITRDAKTQVLELLQRTGLNHFEVATDLQCILKAYQKPILEKAIHPSIVSPGEYLLTCFLPSFCQIYIISIKLT